MTFHSCVGSQCTVELKSEQQSSHSLQITSVAFAPDGKTIVSGSADKTIKVWDAGESLGAPTIAILLPLTPFPRAS